MVGAADIHPLIRLLTPSHTLSHTLSYTFTHPLIHLLTPSHTPYHTLSCSQLRHHDGSLSRLHACHRRAVHPPYCTLHTAHCTVHTHTHTAYCILHTAQFILILILHTAYCILHVTGEQCILAQIAALEGALGYILEHTSSFADGTSPESPPAALLARGGEL
jgi:hypothetical protein